METVIPPPRFLVFHSLRPVRLLFALFLSQGTANALADLWASSYEVKGRGGPLF